MASTNAAVQELDKTLDRVLEMLETIPNYNEQLLELEESRISGTPDSELVVQALDVGLRIGKDSKELEMLIEKLMFLTFLISDEEWTVGLFRKRQLLEEKVKDAMEKEQKGLQSIIGGEWDIDQEWEDFNKNLGEGT